MSDILSFVDAVNALAAGAEMYFVERKKITGMTLADMAELIRNNPGGRFELGEASIGETVKNETAQAEAPKEERRRGRKKKDAAEPKQETVPEPKQEPVPEPKQAATGLKTRLSDVEKARAASLLESGRSAVSIARELRCSTEAVMAARDGATNADGEEYPKFEDDELEALFNEVVEAGE